MHTSAQAVIDLFTRTFACTPAILGAAPGRVNVIGEHTDYNGGFVLPVAIDRDIVCAVKKTDDDTITAVSLDFGEQAHCRVGDYDPAHPAVWFRYIMGVMSELEKAGHAVGGISLAFGGTVPIGAGLSSSAALETAVLTVMEGLLGFHLSDRDAALLCQRAENRFVGMNCGIMDQYISRTGKADHAVLIDCTDLSTTLIEVNTPNHRWLVIDSGKRRGLVDSEYNTRRRECEDGVARARELFPDRAITSLRDVGPDDLPALATVCAPSVFRRVSHVVTENVRVHRTVGALKTGDVATVGRCLYECHASLRDDFEVSCAELDQLVDILGGVTGVAGARVTGAGFGGCVIALVAESAVEEVRTALNHAYHPKTLPAGVSAELWPITISDGAHLLSL